MQKLFISLFLICCLMPLSCTSSSDDLTPEKIVANYINGLNESNFESIKPYLSDSLTTMEGGFVLAKNCAEYYIHFQWDSVFTPQYSLINSKQLSDHSVEVTLSKIGKRIQYLHDTPTVYKAKFDFANNRITQIDNTDLMVFDTLKWTNRRDTLVTWIKIHHPDLDGFVYDQTPNGAQNYLKAIALFNSSK